jgi:FkbM family methyltransferase
MIEIIHVFRKDIGPFDAFKNENAPRAFLNPMHIYKKLILHPSDIVVDIGGYIGEYAMYAALSTKKVFTYEPTPKTFKLLARNTKRFTNITTIQKAVIGNNYQKEVFLFLSKKIGVTNSTAKCCGKLEKILVNAISYDEVVKSGTVVKIDVEGAEYGYDIAKENLRGIIIEFHNDCKANWRVRASKIMDDIEGKGYTCIARPNFENGWDMTGVWVKQ